MYSAIYVIMYLATVFVVIISNWMEGQPLLSIIMSTIFVGFIFVIELLQDIRKELRKKV